MCAIIGSVGHMKLIANAYDSRVFAAGIAVWVSFFLFEVGARFINRFGQALVDMYTVAGDRESDCGSIGRIHRAIENIYGAVNINRGGVQDVTALKAVAARR